VKRQIDLAHGSPSRLRVAGEPRRPRSSLLISYRSASRSRTACASRTSKLHVLSFQPGIGHTSVTGGYWWYWCAWKATSELLQRHTIWRPPPRARRPRPRRPQAAGHARQAPVPGPRPPRRADRPTSAPAAHGRSRGGPQPTRAPTPNCGAGTRAGPAAAAELSSGRRRTGAEHTFGTLLVQRTGEQGVGCLAGSPELSPPLLAGVAVRVVSTEPLRLGDGSLHRVNSMGIATKELETWTAGPNGPSRSPPPPRWPGALESHQPSSE
jgi:hypothetical protein